MPPPKAEASSEFAPLPIPSTNPKDPSALKPSPDKPFKPAPGEKARVYPDGSPVVKGKAALLIDPRTGKVMWEKNAHQRLPIASLTKVMTALLILESGKLDEKVTASKTANETQYSSIYLAVGEKLTLRDLLWGIMLRSANDACVAAAEHLDGSVPKFVERMNRRAVELGLKDTHFVTVNGLHDPNHYSTAADMATITLEAIKHPIFNEMVRTKKHSIQRSIRKQNALFFSRSRILWRWPLADGVKTGYTKQAGHCFIGSATYDGWRLITVILNSPQVGEDTRNLLEYGFNTYRSVLLARAGTPLVYHGVRGGKPGRVALGTATDVYAVIQRGEHNPVGAGYVKAPEGLSAPLRKGEKVADVFWGVREKPARVADLIALETIPETPVRVAARTASTSWWPLALVALTFGALKYGATAKSHRKRRNRVPKRGRAVGGGRTRLR